MAPSIAICLENLLILVKLGDYAVFEWNFIAMVSNHKATLNSIALDQAHVQTKQSK